MPNNGMQLTKVQKELLISMLGERASVLMGQASLFDTEKNRLAEFYARLSGLVATDQSMSVNELGMLGRLVSHRDDVAATTKGLSPAEREILRMPLVAIIVAINAEVERVVREGAKKAKR